MEISHRSWNYNETQVGAMHPNLSFDLLRAQFDACKEIDINVPIYITAGVNNRVAEEHPEWRLITPEGNLGGWTDSPLKAGFKTLCFNTPYLDYLCELIREVASQYPDCDGIFTDIIEQHQCCCRWCLADMAAEGYDPEVEADRKRFSKRTLRKYYKASTAAAKHVDPAMPIFHNSGHIQRGETEILQYFDHLELESLPTGGWGYDHFPMSAKYCEKLPHDFLGMTGKFHTSWGEFGGIKHPNALRYECAAMLAYGSKCSVGDQLHPSGRLDETTYRVIGQAFSEVAAKEPWCDHVETLADVAILSTVAVDEAHPRVCSADIGASRILLEEQIPFTIIDGEMDFAPYKLLILPDDIKIKPPLKAKLDTYLAAGGKLLLSGQSGVSDEGDRFIFDTGATVDGVSEFSPDYLLPVEALRPDFVSTPVVAYTPSYRIKVSDGQSLGEVYDPYFNRAYDHFCSHQHTPYREQASGYDCGVRKGNILYLAHAVFSLYRGLGAVVYKEYAARAIRRLLGDDLSVQTNMPSTARLNLNDQPGESRYVLHLLFANTVNRGGRISLQGGNMVGSAKGTEVIEELLPLSNTTVELKTPRQVTGARLEPQGEECPFETTERGIRLTIESFSCHQMVVLDYASC
ncbi:MAG: beta-galactosidase [Verrucomicrobia bacterium]|nr:beta-galactosidase [Verrucomicrobiota bacterium]MBT7069242.1 beta-galactosidase [Verrucomicrobiota bacterium]MBT7702526.1 beta-galactosidase [Verrucomicrobiota bacterium]